MESITDSERMTAAGEGRRGQVGYILLTGRTKRADCAVGNGYLSDALLTAPTHTCPVLRYAVRACVDSRQFALAPARCPDPSASPLTSPESAARSCRTTASPATARTTRPARPT